MSESMLRYYESTSAKIKAGEVYTLYFIYCSACKDYKRIMASPPAGPGGTLSCPICGIKKENGPGIESSYGRVHCRPFKVLLPKICDIGVEVDG